MIIKKVLGKKRPRKQTLMLIFQGNNVIGTLLVFLFAFNYCFHSCWKINEIIHRELDKWSKKTVEATIHRGLDKWPKNGFLTMVVM